MNRRTFLTAGAAALAAPLVLTPSKTRAAAPDEAEDGFVSLFDGKTLSGWHKNRQRIGHGTGGLWQVEDGAITGEQDPPGSGNGGILLTDRTYGDFDLRLELRPDFGPDSGLFLRSTEKGDCIQMMVDYHDGGNVGHLYGEGNTGGWNTRPYRFDGVIGEVGKLTALKTKPFTGYKNSYNVSSCRAEEFVKAWRLDDWNRCRVVVTGGRLPTITTWINDLRVCEWDAKTCNHPQYNKEKVARVLGSEGHIAVQVHGGKGGGRPGQKCRWRNIRIKQLS